MKIRININEIILLRILFDNKIICVECEGDNHIQGVSDRWLLLRRNEKCETYQYWGEIVLDIKRMTIYKLNVS